jgi:hypothetical protein
VIFSEAGQFGRFKHIFDGNAQLCQQTTVIGVGKMRKIDDDFQRNLGCANRAEFTVKTPFSYCLNERSYSSKKIIKTACEIFHDAASFTRSGQNWFQNRGISFPCPGVFY